MALRIDLHLHTRRHSRCSRIDEAALIRRAVAAGLDGIVITEHHYQWNETELRALRDAAAADAPGFLVLAGFEYTSACGDILIYGLAPEDTALFPPGGDPAAMLAQAQALGAACIAAHPTRAAISFDERIAQMPFDGIEVASVNLAPHEQRLARNLAQMLGIPPSAASDAHRLEDVGAYATEFDTVIRTAADLRDSLKHGRFRPAQSRG